MKSFSLLFILSFMIIIFFIVVTIRETCRTEKNKTYYIHQHKNNQLRKNVKKQQQQSANLDGLDDYMRTQIFLNKRRK